MAQDPWASFQDVAVVDNPPAGRTGAPANDPWAAFQDVPVTGGKPAGTPSWWDTAKDVAQSAATGIEKGAIGAVTLPATIDRAGRAGFGRMLDYVLPQPSKPATQQPPDVSDYFSVAGAEKAADALGVPFYKPQTTAGRYAETVGEFVPGATSGGARSLLKYAVAPGVASEAAGEATQGTVAEPYARGVAALAAGGVAGLASRPGTAAGVLSEAAGPLDAATLSKAQGLMDAARAQGSPLTLAEAVQQITNGGTRLGAVQRVVEQSRGGADTMAKFYADRPDQVQQAGRAAVDRVGTVPVVPLDGSMGPTLPNTAAIGPGVQRAAQGVVDASPQAQNARQAITDAGPRVGAEQAGQVIQPGLRGAYDARLEARSAQARQDYAAAGSDEVSPEAIQSIMDDLDKQAAADKTGLLAGRLRDLRNRISTPGKVEGPQWELDPVPSGRAPDAPRDMDFGPTDNGVRGTAPRRPDAPQPQSLHDFVKSLGGVQDPRGDLTAMGLADIPGLVARPGKGLGPDAVRQVAAEAGYLGPHIDDAMANTTVNHLFDALGSEHPVYSVHDQGAVDAWNRYAVHRDAWEQQGVPNSRPAQAGRMPVSVYRDEIAAAPPGEPARAPITDVENLNRARKTFRDRIALPATAPKAIDKETAATIGPVLGDLDRAMIEGSPAYAKANENFARNSVPLEPFQNTPGIARSIEQDEFGKRFVTPPEKVPGAILGGGPSTARAFNGVATPPVRKALEDHLTTRILDQGTDASGLVNPDRLTKALRDNTDTLAHYPTVQKRVQQVVDTQRALAPLQNTMVGRLAATPKFREQAAMILDPNPVPGSAREVGDAVRKIAAQSPAAARALVSQHIRQVFAETTQANMGGPNQWGGAKFNAAIRGNSEQAENLRAVVEALHGKGGWENFSQTLDVFEAMGRRQAPGSQTEFNRQLSKELQKGGKVGELAASAASPSEWMSKAKDLYDGWRYGRNTAALAEMLTRPDAATRLGQIAKAPKGSSASTGMATAYLLSSAANQTRERVAH